MTTIGRRTIPEPGGVPTPIEQTIIRTYTLKLVTPMFGGGSTAGEVDRHRPIRASSIRGHLRSWWRLLNREKFADVAAMRNRESEIWGSTDNPSPISVEVVKYPSFEVLYCSDQKEPFSKKTRGEKEPLPLPYVVFPFLGKLNSQGATFLPAKKEFELQIRLNGLDESSISEIESAVDAWIRFGGIGARTRRGCGSLHSTKLQLDSLNPPPGCDLFLGPPVGVSSADAITAWAQAVTVYQDFRQLSYRNPGPGRTHWPEPDSIRKATTCSSERHKEPMVASSEVGTFPKAVLGLPIVFHFKDARDKDPPDVDLCHNMGHGGNDKDGRMASPVVIRPVFVPNPKIPTEGMWAPAILVLPDAHLAKLECRLTSKSATFLNGADLIPTNLIRGTAVQGLKPLKDQKADNALDALLSFAMKRGFKKVGDRSK